MNRLCEILRPGLPHLTFAEERIFLEGMDIKLRLDGNKVTIAGLIIERTLIIADKRAVRSGATDDGILCHTSRKRDFLLFYLFCGSLAGNIVDSILNVSLCVAHGAFYVAFSLVGLSLCLSSISSGLHIDVAGGATCAFLNFTGCFLGFTLHSVA
jgi:hypothetical protein